MDATELINYFVRTVLGYLVPAVLGTAGVLGVLFATPLGRGLVRWLGARREETELMEAVLSELAQLRGTLIDTTERIDALERRLTRERDGALLPPPGLDPAAAERLTTPH